MNFKFKEENTFDQRNEEATKIRCKYPDRVPVIVERWPGSSVPIIDKRKFLVPADISVAQFIWIIRKRIQLPPAKALFLFVGKMLPQTSVQRDKYSSYSCRRHHFTTIQMSGEVHAYDRDVGECFKCGRQGHLARECRSGGGGAGRGGGGYGSRIVVPRNRMGDRGGRSKDAGRVRGDSGSSYHGGEDGSRGDGDRRYRRGRGGRRGGRLERCFKCNRTGHYVRDCTEEQDCCYICNKLGHIARDCSQDPSSPVCYICGDTTHLQRDCPDADVKKCYDCGDPGHEVRNCPNRAGGGGRSRDNRECYTCGEQGHLSRNCTADVQGERQRGGGSGNAVYDDGPVCYRCGERGHIARNCTQEEDLSRDGGGGGRLGRGGGRRRGKSNVRCYNCDRFGHIASECTAAPRRDDDR